MVSFFSRIHESDNRLSRKWAHGCENFRGNLPGLDLIACNPMIIVLVERGVGALGKGKAASNEKKKDKGDFLQSIRFLEPQNCPFYLILGQI